MTDLRVEVRQDRGRVTFVLATTAGTPRVSGVVVFDEGTGQHCWLVSPGPPGGVDLRYELEMAVRRAGLSLPPGVDPIEDLPPSDPRRRLAEEQLLHGA